MQAPSERALDVVRRANAYDGPSAERLQGIHAGLTARIAAGDPLSDPLEADPATGGSGSAIPGVLKVVAGIAGLAAIIAGVAVLGGDAPSDHDTPPQPPTQVAAASPAPPPTPVHPPEAVTPAQAVEDAPAAAPVPEPEATRADMPRTKPNRRAPRSTAAKAPTALDDVSEEVELVGRARRKLATGSPKEALKLLRDHARRFPRGVMREEGRVLEAEALCASGQASAARKRADRFVADHPSSPMRKRAEGICRD